MVHHLVLSVRSAATRGLEGASDRARRVLRRIERHRAPWIRDAAREAMRVLG